MKQHKLTEADMKQIAHHIAQRNISTIPTGMNNEATNEYLEAYNQVLEVLYNYNINAKD